MVALAPTVADARPFFDDEGINPLLVEPRRNRKPGLRGADDQDGRLAIFIGDRFTTHIGPVVAAEIA